MKIEVLKEANMSKLSPKLLFLIALVISLIAAFLMYNQLKKVNKENLGSTIEVVIAIADIPPKTLITDQLVTTSRLPIEIVQKGAYSVTQEVLGKYSKVAIAKSEQVTSARLAQNERGSGLVAALPSDKRAITVGVTDTTGLTGLAKAGDKVDIVSIKSHSGNVSGQILLQDVMIMAINRTELSQEVGDEKGAKPEKLATVTLAVNPRDAVLLALAQAQGTLQLILRPVAPTEAFVSNTLVVEQGAIPSGGERQDLMNSFGIRVIKGSDNKNAPAVGANTGQDAAAQSGAIKAVGASQNIQNIKR